MLRFYVAVGWTAFQRQLIYRWANIAGLLTNIFFGTVFSYVIIALFHARPITVGFDVRDTLRYTWLIQAMIMIVLPFHWIDLMLTIRSGAVISDLSKPCDFYWYWFSREIGRNLYSLLFRGIPTYIAGMLLFGFGLPGSWQQWLLFILSLIIGANIGIAYRYFYNLAAFWIVEANAFATLCGTIGLFFTGSYVPIPFFPSWLLTITQWLPFNALMNVPVELLLGKVTGNAIIFELIRQIVWMILLTIGVRLLTSIATRRVVVQGG